MAACISSREDGDTGTEIYTRPADDHAPGPDCRVMALCVLCGGDIHCCDDGMSYHGASAHMECAISRYETNDLW
jgi:hypothetical protein